jgi:cellulose synthase/poly-beta-1,6-N-acetylglucosamine synthase-like glycosyltransferase
VTDVSILIPARNEEHLQRTISSILANIEADTEIIAVLDGYWPDPNVALKWRVHSSIAGFIEGAVDGPVGSTSPLIDGDREGKGETISRGIGCSCKKLSTFSSGVVESFMESS